MSKWIFILVAALISVACSGEKSTVESVLKKRLNDPTSAIIGKVIISKDSLHSCIEYNDKNKYGEYVGLRIAKLKKISEQWVVQDTDVYLSSCTPAGFIESDNREALYSSNESYVAGEELEVLQIALAEALEAAVSAFLKGRNISRESAISSLKEGKCSNNFGLLETAFVNRAEYTISGKDTIYLDSKILELLNTFAEGRCNPI
jgi:hypothetical protein